MPAGDSDAIAFLSATLGTVQGTISGEIYMLGSIIVGFFIAMAGAYVTYQSFYDSTITAHNVSWLQGTAGLMVGIFVMAFGISIVVVSAVKLAADMTRNDRF